MFIDEKCGNLKVFIDGGELIRSIKQKKTSNVLQAYSYRSSLSDELEFSCGYVAYNLKGRKLFSDQMNRNCADLILGMHNRNCCTVGNLRCLDSAVNETL